MRHFPEDYGGIDELHLDALERARLSLDFEAMNTTAPSVKEVLFRAQTMGPLAPVREVPRVSWPGMALAFCLLALLMPWMPIDTSVTVMQVGFEQELPRLRANDVASHLLRNQPKDVLLGTQFVKTDHMDGINVDGQLRLNLTAFNMDAAEVQSLYQKQIAEAQRSSGGSELQPLFRTNYEARQRHYWSPAKLFARALAPRSRGEAELPGKAEMEQLITGNTLLLAQALAPNIAKVDSRVKLDSLQFTDSPTAAGFDFVMPAWPQPVGFNVSNYQALTAGEQSKVRAAAQAFIDSSNLALPASAAGGDLLTADLPVQVQVYGSDGSFDPRATTMVQAHLRQPSAQDMQRLDYSPAPAVEAAVAAAMPDTAFSATYSRVPTNGRLQHAVTVNLLGRAGRRLKDPTEQAEAATGDAGGSQF